MNLEADQLSIISYIPGGIGLILSAFLVSITMGAAEFKRERQKVVSGYRRTFFGRFIKLIVGNSSDAISINCRYNILTISVFTTLGKITMGLSSLSSLSQSKQLFMFVLEAIYLYKKKMKL